MLKENGSEYNLSEKINNVHFLPCFGVCTPTQYALSCKIQKLSIYTNQMKSKYYVGTPMLMEKLL